MFDILYSVFFDFLGYFIDIFLRLPGVILAITAHEFAHAFVANKLGDRSAKAMGRLSLNPIKHIDPVGFLCLVLFRFGWTSPVPVNSKNFKNQKLGLFLTTISGPLANLLLAFLGCFVFTAFTLLKPYCITEIYLRVPYTLTETIIGQFCLVNVTIAIFNLIPLPPLDGFKILSLIIPKHSYHAFMKYEKFFSLGFLIILLIDFYFFAYISDALLLGANFVLNKCFMPLFNMIFY